MRVALALFLGICISAGAFAQESWPSRPIRFILPFPPGGGTDILGRVIADRLSASLGQPVVIENRGGAGGGVGAAEAARAAPDGYTLFFPSGSVVTANQHIYAKLNYDPEKDFVPVTKVVSGPQVLVVPANSPYKTVKE
ncbi:MAG TPA: tripartite tricarboxylate transporter substrate-binding protein, partial [Burkholderiales bacterium]|nr:tripartite tricarboxylate transporter substrate-binding protein [Burkholderiales bacterium]